MHLTNRGMEAARGCPASVALCELGTEAMRVCWWSGLQAWVQGADCEMQNLKIDSGPISP